MTKTAPAGETMDICKVTLKLNREFVHPAHILAVSKSNYSDLHSQRKAGRMNRNNTKMKKDPTVLQVLPFFPSYQRS